MMHYHIYFGPKADKIPKDIYNFTDSTEAIDKVISLMEEHGMGNDLADMEHVDNEIGRFSIIVVPQFDYKIVLHECTHTCNISLKEKKIAASMLN
jgi:hypothetical protein